VFLVYASGSVTRFTTGGEALAYAEETARAAAQAQAKALGAGNFETAARREVVRPPDAINDDGLSHARIEAEAIGQVSFAGH
jgi:hypothetical protein